MSNNTTNFKGVLRKNQSLAEYTSWKIGGPADYLYEPADLHDLVNFLRCWKDNPVIVFGAGTNILVRDRGIRGMVIYLRNKLSKLEEIEDGSLKVEAGVGLAKLVGKCLQLGLMDAAHFAGIPGTIGGALAMNAGAYGKYIWDYVIAVETINRFGEICKRKAQDFIPGYRTLQGLEKDEWFVSATLQFPKGDIPAMQEKIGYYLAKRKKSQPLEFPSCGSVFRNPPGDYAARLIEDCELKGKQQGGAKISEKHANFIINYDNAMAQDVETLICEIIEVVLTKHGIKLITEVNIVGE